MGERSRGRRADDRPYVENEDFLRFARRILRALGRRAHSDMELLSDLATVRDEIDEQIRVAVGGARAEGRSWSEIAQRLGTTKQAAHERYGQGRSSASGHLDDRPRNILSA